MGLFEHFPHTNFHEQNLDWYLRKTLYLLQEVQALRQYVDERLEDMQNKLDSRIAKWQEQLDKLESDILKSLEDVISKVNQTLEQSQKDIADLIASQEQRLNEIMAEIQSQYWNIRAYVDSEIARVIDMINKPIEGPVFNVFRQKTDTIQNTLYDYYNFLRAHAFKAGWFDGVGVTAGEFDGLGKTTLEWDMSGFHIINDSRRSWPWFSYSPWTGLRTPNSDLIYQLAEYHGVGLTCGDWDGMDYTCGTFDGKGYTAWMIDWTNQPLELNT